MQTVDTLRRSPVMPLTIHLFDTRWRGERKVTPDHVIRAHRNLGLIDAPWPDRTASLAEVQAIQAELDKLTD
jgi:hypothetical protein